MEGKPLQQAVEVVRDKFVPTMIANYMVRAEGARAPSPHEAFKRTWP